jgi:RimJ/RimL family protein N-acetyltransferase
MSPESKLTLASPRLQLLLSTTAHLEKLIEGPSAFETAFGMRVIEGYNEFPESLRYSLEVMVQLAGTPAADWWTPYLFVHREERAVIGLGGFKGPQDETGMVEFGYGIAPAYRQQGYATEAALALMAYASSCAGVTLLRAHTLPEVNASTRVLAKCGLVKVAEVIDPQDGLIWRWERPVEASNTPSAQD